MSGLAYLGEDGKNMHSFGFNVGYGGHRRKAYFKIYLGYMLNKYGL